MLAAPSQVGGPFHRQAQRSEPGRRHDGRSRLGERQEAFLGYLSEPGIGLPLGLFMGWFSVVRGIARPIFELIRPIPPIAWIPLTIFWFGIGISGKVFIIWLGGMVPCVINSFVGVRMTNPTLIQMSRTYGATDWQIFTEPVHPLGPADGLRRPADRPGLLLDQPGGRRTASRPTRAWVI